MISNMLKAKYGLMYFMKLSVIFLNIYEILSSDPPCETGHEVKPESAKLSKPIAVTLCPCVKVLLCS